MTAVPSPIDVVDIPERCGNAPRKAVIRDFLIALYSRDTEHVVDVITSDIQWKLIASGAMDSSTAVREWLQDQPKVVALELHTVITHGTDCGADGVVTLEDGTRRHFSHIMIFAGHAKSAKIKTIRTYHIAA